MFHYTHKSRPILRRSLCQYQCRLKSSKPSSDNNKKKKVNNDSANSSQLTKKNQNNNDLSSFKIKNEPPRSSPAPMDNIIMETLLKKDNKPYIPKSQHRRVTFDYPELPNEDEFNTLNKKPKVITRWSRYFPKILSFIVAGWGAYTLKVWYFDNPEEGETSNDLLSPNEFHKFIVTHKEQIDNDHYIIELKPKYDKWEMSFESNADSKSIWNGNKIWSVEVKQPDINVVRSYTPLPLYYLKSEYTRSGERKPLLKVLNPETDGIKEKGTMCFYVKRYPHGEVSRYITSREVGQELELRGPQIEYKFPYHPLNKLHQRPIFKDLPSKVEPDNSIESIKKFNRLPDVDNLNFFAAGTGIAPILQVLFSENPYMGFVNIHYSAQKSGEIGILERFLFFLSKLDRVNMYFHLDSQGKSSILNKKDIKKPETPNYITPQRMELKTKALSPEESLKLRMSIRNGEGESESYKKLISSAEERGERYDSALEQAMQTSKISKKPAALSIVCGPEGYIEYVAGPKDLVNKSQGVIGGLLGEKNWDNSNVYKL
ncbi:CYC2 [Candida pseudojiufengensis]|uniref:CYC2 n=1 Tax=Candida pseudojiufengensis TaxID=497109 RepID=UPI002225659E|nr:CYC2 [Candida pseudojiufengensis]KAI5964111.1 CYC2 [Candida pseudojiufengensis]